MEVTLHILAKDILESSYNDSENCPITKALHRAGFTDLFDMGLGIRTRGFKTVHMHTDDNDDVSTRVIKMYRWVWGVGNLIEEPKDFSVTLNLDI